jgi:Tol biopolymer transport system component
LDVCRQIAEGLEAAHDKGVIHRDLKPANVKITPEGKVKILDFGLAKAFQGETSGVDASKSPTLTDQMTRPGVILGTAAYMAPEQAKGKAVDKRADVWALGCILYECLAGRRAFQGESITETLASILKGEPDSSALPQITPGIIRFLLRQCLQKDPARRLRDIRDFRLHLAEEVLEDGKIVPSAQVQSASRARRILPWLAAAVCFALAAASLILWSPWNRDRSEHLPLRFSIELPPEAPLAPSSFMPLGVGRPSLALSPDGKSVVYVALVGGRTQLYLHNMITGKFQPIEGAVDARNPFFSPDGQWIGFFAGNRLKKISLAGGESFPLAECYSLESGAVWGKDNQIYFNPDNGQGIFRVPSSGGNVTRATPATFFTQTWPEILPSGDMLVSRYGWNGISVASKSDPNTSLKSLLDYGSNAHYVPTGDLVYARPGELVVSRFDRRELSVSGDPVIIADDLRTEEAGAGQFAVSAEGTLVYVPGKHACVGSFLWRDRQGKTYPVDLPARFYANPSISPDGQQVAYVVFDMGQSNIYIYEFGHGEIRITPGGRNTSPLWSPDGKALFYQSERDKIQTLYAVQPERRQNPWQLTDGKTNSSLYAVTPDGKEIIAVQGENYVLIPAAPGDPNSISKPKVLLPAKQLRWTWAFSPPDGRYLLTTSAENNRWEIFLQSYQTLDRQQLISLAGGEEPRWNRNGKEIVYRWGSQWWAVDVQLQPQIEYGKPHLLFEGPYINVPGYSWDISSNGERFLLLESPEQNKPVTRLAVITNFLDEVKRRLHKN